MYFSLSFFLGSVLEEMFISPAGVFSWIAINYLVGRLSPESHLLASRHRHSAPPTTPSDDTSTVVGGAAGMGGSDGWPRTPSIHTVGSLDLGGASLQVAFEIPPDVSGSGFKLVWWGIGGMLAGKWRDAGG